MSALHRPKRESPSAPRERSPVCPPTRPQGESEERSARVVQ